MMLARCQEMLLSMQLAQPPAMHALPSSACMMRPRSSALWQTDLRFQALLVLPVVCNHVCPCAAGSYLRNTSQCKQIETRVRHLNGVHICKRCQMAACCICTCRKGISLRCLLLTLPRRICSASHARAVQALTDTWICLPRCASRRNCSRNLLSKVLVH